MTLINVLTVIIDRISIEVCISFRVGKCRQPLYTTNITPLYKVLHTTGYYYFEFKS